MIAQGIDIQWIAAASPMSLAGKRTGRIADAMLQRRGEKRKPRFGA
jgi:hypothetical protein